MEFQFKSVLDFLGVLPQIRPNQLKFLENLSKIHSEKWFTTFKQMIVPTHTNFQVLNEYTRTNYNCFTFCIVKSIHQLKHTIQHLNQVFCQFED